MVNISVATMAPERYNPLFRDPFFRRFFDLPDDAPARPRQSAGSGVIVDAGQGLVLTNHHVVEKAEEVMVTLKDRRRFEADILGSDPGTDIALLKIEAEGLASLPFGDSDVLQVGDFVIAIGNPFGLGQTVTSGIVSALGRSGINVEGYEDFIQTDASINPGNSGGALVNLHGELVGINTAIIGPSGGNVGIGFAVPVNIATAVMRQLEEHGEMQRGRIGVMIQDLTPDLAEALDLDVARGTLISRVESGSPAEDAGLQAGDVIVAVNGSEVEGSRDLRNAIGMVRVGEEITVEVQREQRRIRLAVRVGRAETGMRLGSVDIPPALRGAALRDLRQGDPGHDRIEGVIAAEVEPGSPAAPQRHPAGRRHRGREPAPRAQQRGAGSRVRAGRPRARAQHRAWQRPVVHRHPLIGAVLRLSAPALSGSWPGCRRGTGQRAERKRETLPEREIRKGVAGSEASEP